MKNWKPYLATLAAGIVIGYLLHQPPTPIAEQTLANSSHSEANNTSHSEKSKDADSVRIVVRYVNVTPPTATTGQIFGRAFDSSKCPKFDLHFVATDSGGGFIEAFVFGIDCQHHSADSTRFVPSKRNLAVTDTFSKSTHTEITRDSASRVSSDSSASAKIVTLASHSLYDLSVELSTPVFLNGTFGYSPSGTLVSIPARLHLTDVFVAGLRPEFMLLTPSIGSARIYLDCSFKIAGH